MENLTFGLFFKYFAFYFLATGISGVLFVLINHILLINEAFKINNSSELNALLFCEKNNIVFKARELEIETLNEKKISEMKVFVDEELYTLTFFFSFIVVPFTAIFFTVKILAKLVSISLFLLIKKITKDKKNKQ